jgi:hypothetical protein
MKDDYYIDEQLHFTRDEIVTFCKINEDNNPEHNINLDRVLVPGLLVAGKAFGKTEKTTYLMEQSVRFKDKIFLDENIFVRKRLIREKKLKAGLFQHISLEVFSNGSVKYDGWIKILKVEVDK